MGYVAWTNGQACNPNPNPNTLPTRPSPNTHSLSPQIFERLAPQRHSPMPEPLEYRRVGTFWIVTDVVQESFLILRPLGRTMTHRGKQWELKKGCFSSSWAVFSKFEGCLPYGRFIFSLTSQYSVLSAPSPPTPLIYTTRIYITWIPCSIQQSSPQLLVRCRTVP
jgi:hypothetical protein